MENDSEFEVDIQEINFAITKDTNSDLLFVKTETGAKAIGYATALEDDDYQYQLSPQDGYKQYTINIGDVPQTV